MATWASMVGQRLFGGLGEGVGGGAQERGPGMACTYTVTVAAQQVMSTCVAVALFSVSHPSDTTSGGGMAFGGFLLQTCFAIQCCCVLLLPCAAGMLSCLAHEITETASDPVINAWYNLYGYENADICAWQFGAKRLKRNAQGKVFNVRDVNGRDYFLQINFNPNSGTCIIGV